ncbi:hypothetical protein PybrP1_008038 [[Pythium] brassicae (nom. inval.)]|nr:hypothetical protein PybrP1_008038 [[Pythium] brassicae (nom. inval.)]
MDLTLEEEGAQVTAATSFDPNFPPANILDGEHATKWVTTGSFPQEVVVQLATTASISRVKTWSTNVKEVTVELNENDGNLQVESESVKLGDASFIKFKIVSGWNDFVALHRVSVEGSTSRR